MNQESKRDHVQHCANDNKDFKSADSVHNQAQKGADDDAGKAVERGHAGGGVLGKVKGNNQDGPQEIRLHGEGEIEEDGDSHGSPDRTVLHVGKRNKRVRRPELPIDKGRNTYDADDNGRNDVSRLPLGALSARKRERNKHELKNGNNENDANDIQKPEQLEGKIFETQLLK